MPGTAPGARWNPFRPIVNWMMRLPPGVREIAFLTPPMGILTLSTLGLSPPATSEKLKMHGRVDVPLNSYHLEPIYNEHGKHIAYREVKHKPPITDK